MPRRPSLAAQALLLLSPHFDDAALSCAALLERTEPVDVVTVFGGEPDPPQQGFWDRWCGFESSAESIPARRREEESAFRGSRHRVKWLSLLEGQYVVGPRPELERMAIRDAVVAWSTRMGGGTVAIPAGAGRTPGRVAWRLALLAPGRLGFIQHPDHTFVRDTVLEVLADTEALTGLLYEELPYLWTRTADREVAAAAAGWGFVAEPMALPVDRSAKAERIAVYSSQLTRLSSRRGKPHQPESLPEFERYWRLERAVG